VSTGIFGGTFDPIHIGHLRTALEMRSLIGLARMLLVPCGDPPHKEYPMTPAADRLAMLRRAVVDEPTLVVDTREIDRGGLSYTIDTLVELRAELGDGEPLCLCIGMDSLVNIDSWRRWREFLDLAHIAVAARPGWRVPEKGEVAQWLAQHLVADAGALLASPAGSIFIEEMTLLPISATNLRSMLARGESIRYLTPDGVIDYIHSRHLYVQ